MINLNSTPEQQQQTLDELKLREQQLGQTQAVNAPSVLNTAQPIRSSNLPLQASHTQISTEHVNVGVSIVKTDTINKETGAEQHQKVSDAVVIQAKDTHRLVIEWVRALDAKVSPILTAASAFSAGCVAALGQHDILQSSCPLTYSLLAVTLVPLIYSVMMSISAISPSLKWDRWGANRHLPDLSKTASPSVVFFGQIAGVKENDYIANAKTVFADNEALLDDILKQTHINANIATNKSVHIALSARGLFVSVLMLALSGVAFLMKL